MKIFLLAAGALLALACAMPAAAANGPTYTNAAGVKAPTNGVTIVNPDGTLFQQGAVPAAATACSGTIAAGGSAQDLFAAGTAVHGWAIENQSAGDLYVVSKGAAGSTVATQDQNSLKVPAGAYYEAPHVSPYAQSITGATTAQSFYCRAW